MILAAVIISGFLVATWLALDEPRDYRPDDLADGDALAVDLAEFIPFHSPTL